jgi:diguanylate cyclase (GGDEF)-like protein/putative nucleotidyltransferase with HDIG domain
MLVFDMDHFKNINDNYGHTAGDAIISETGRLLQMHCPAGSIALRLGGDEFAVFLLGDEASKMDEFAALLLDTFRTRVFRGGGCPLHITISCGTANISDPGIENESQFFDAADKALYLAKKRGRNQTGRYTDTLQTPGAGQTESASPPAEPKDAPQSKGKILVVDDEIQIVELLKRLLTHCKYEVITANNPNKAFEIVKSHPDAIDVMLTDINMPEMSGTELLKAVASVAPNIVTVIISGYVTTENTVAALRAGAYNILAKPFKLDEIEIVVARAVERRRMKRELDAYHVGIEQLLQEKTKALNTAYDDLKDAYVKTMEIIIRMLDIHESDTALHSRRVSLYTLFLAGKMGVSDPEELKNIKYGALFHDIGKIAIPDSILKKPSTLTAGEMNIVRSHAHMGYEIVSSIPALKSAAEIVWSHHERFDGKGYPRGLAGKDICLGARIFSVVDTFDALRYDRSYRMGKGIEEVVAEINRCCGSQFDPEVVAVFNSCYMELDKIDVPLESDGGAPLL